MIDISALLYLVQDNEELKYRLLSLVEFTTEDIELKEQIYEEKAQIKGFPISDVSEAERHHAWIVEYEKRISKDANIYTILITNSKSIDEDTRIYAGNIYYVHREEYVSWAIKALTIIRSVWNMFTDEGDMEWRDPVHQQFIEEGITPKNYLDFVCKQNLRDIE